MRAGLGHRLGRRRRVRAGPAPALSLRKRCDCSDSASEWVSRLDRNTVRWAALTSDAGRVAHPRAAEIVRGVADALLTEW
jgi:hypothetical protein